MLTRLTQKAKCREHLCGTIPTKNDQIGGQSIVYLFYDLHILNGRHTAV